LFTARFGQRVELGLAPGFGFAPFGAKPATLFSRYNAGYRDPCCTCNTEFEIWRIRCAIPYPWIGASATILRIRTSSVPCKRSDFFASMVKPRRSTYTSRYVECQGFATPTVHYHIGMLSEEGRTRPAVIEDAPAIARVHIESWKTTYAGIFPDNLLEQLSIPDRTRFWNETLAKPTDRFITLVACDETEELWDSFVAARKGAASSDVTASSRRCT